MERQVICIKWGVKYGPDYVNRLYGMVARNLTPPFTFVCFTDDDAGIRAEVRCEPLPPLGTDAPQSRGKWPKARLWNAELADLTGPVLFLDLDLVVTGRLDDLFTWGDPDEIVLTRNQTTPLERLGQTSVYRFPVGKLVPLREKFLADPQGVADAYTFEQRFVTRNAPGGVRFFPARWIRHFRQNCLQPFPLNYLAPPNLPADARIVIFPGGLYPNFAAEGRYAKRYTPMGPGAHLRGLFSSDRPDPPWRYLKRYMMPAPWVAEHWRE